MTKNLKATVLGVALMLGAVLGFGLGGVQALASDRTDIEAAIKKYDRAFNATDVDGIMALYTADAVLMPPNRQPVFGVENVGEFYARLFNDVRISGALDFQEVVSLSDDWAFVRTTSVSNIVIKSNGDEISAHGQELFILHKDEGWKIARYMFSSTLPRR